MPDTAARLARQPRSAMFVDYRMPAAARTPWIDVLTAQDSPAAGNPLEVRGAGEGWVCAAGTALARAVREARGRAGSVGRLPLPLAGVRQLATNGGSR